MRAFLSFIALFIFSIAHAQFGQWDWMNYASGSLPDPYNVLSGTSVCTDASHNVYVLGEYDRSVQFDTFQLANSSYGNPNMFLAKYDPSGNLLWVTRSISHFGCYGTTLKLDAAGCVYVGGNFSDTVIFGSTQLTSRNSGYLEIFIAKYDANGNVIWAKRAGEGSVGFSYPGLASDAMQLDKGYIYIAGSLGSGVSYFDTIQISTQSALFLAKYDTSGNAIWAKIAGNGIDRNNTTLGLTLDDSDHIFITGKFGPDPIYFDSIELSAPMGVITNGNMFIAKYSNNGSAIWARSALSYDITDPQNRIPVNKGLAIVTDNAGGVIVTGSVMADSTLFDNIPVISNGDVSNGFIAKYSSAGSVIWAKKMNKDDLSYNYPSAMSIGANGNMNIVGAFKNTGTYDNKMITSNGGGDIYIAQYNNNGYLQWLTSVGGPMNDAGQGITSDNTGAVYITGSILDSCSFGNYTITGTNGNMFVAKMTPPALGVQQAAKPAGFIGVYPNPADGSATVTLTSDLNVLRVTDQLGRAVYIHTISGQREITLNTSMFVDGIYFITCETNTGGRVSNTLIIAH